MTATARSPFPVPFGWFCVGYPEDFPVGQPRALFYFDRHLVGWRDDDGGLHVQDPFCPHLGAHLGHGGTVEGCEIVCPFHGWRFDAEGVNTDIPYSERTNQKGRLRTFPVLERNGVSLVWYHPDPDVAPQWDVPELPELAVTPSGPPPSAPSTPSMLPGRRWPRTAWTPLTSGSCTTPPRCR